MSRTAARYVRSSLSLSLFLCACPEESPETPLADTSTDDEVGDSSAGADTTGTDTSGTDSDSEQESSETDSSSQEESSETDSSSQEESDSTGSDYEGDPLFDPECSVWHATKLRALGLDSVWTDGVNVIAGGDVDIVEGSLGQWSEFDDTSLPSQVGPIVRVWGLPGAHWLLAHDGESGRGLYARDGDALVEEHLFDPVPSASDLTLSDLSGSGFDNVWAVATPECDGIACQIDPQCACEQTPAQLVHFDGQVWTGQLAPAQIRAMWTDGGTTLAAGEGSSGDAGGVVYRREGEEWVQESIGNSESLRCLGGVGAEDLWAGGVGGALLRRTGNGWQSFDLPTAETVVRVVAVDASEAYALTEGGELWRFDGQSWALWIEVPTIRDIGVLDDGLIGVGVDSLLDDGHLIVHIDGDGGLTQEYSRVDDFGPTTFAVDSMDSAVGSDRFPHLNRRFDGLGWAPTYESFNQGFSELLGPVDEGWGWVGGVPSPGDAIWQISGGEVLAHPDPLANTAVYTDAKLIERDGELQLWVAGRDLGPKAPMVHQLSAGQWNDRSPDTPDASSAGRLAGAEGRVFTVVSASNPVALQLLHSDVDGLWTELAHPFEWIDHLMATGAEQLWVTGYVEAAEGNQLYGWDGRAWQRADEQWPELAGLEGWQRMAQRSDTDAWVMTSKPDAVERLIHWDGADWQLLDTPGQLHGWDNPRGNRLGPGPDGLFVVDGLRRWRLEYCPE